MTQNLAQRLILLRLVAFASEPSAKLGFDHAKGRFNIRALMIVRQELIAFVLVEVKHLGSCNQLVLGNELSNELRSDAF